MFKKAPKPVPVPATQDEVEQAEFERNVLFNELKKRGFPVQKSGHNVVWCDIGDRFTMAAYARGWDAKTDGWATRTVDNYETVQREASELQGISDQHVIDYFETLRNYANREK